MPKLVKEYENGITKSTLTFREKNFVLVMGQYINGVGKSKEKCFSGQIEQTFADDPNMPDMAEAADDLDFGDDDEIQDALELLGQYE
jgi:hypothetical protein